MGIPIVKIRRFGIPSIFLAGILTLVDQHLYIKCPRLWASIFNTYIWHIGQLHIQRLAHPISTYAKIEIITVRYILWNGRRAYKNDVDIYILTTELWICTHVRNAHVSANTERFFSHISLNKLRIDWCRSFHVTASFLTLATPLWFLKPNRALALAFEENLTGIERLGFRTKSSQAWHFFKLLRYLEPSSFIKGVFPVGRIQSWVYM